MDFLLLILGLAGLWLGTELTIRGALSIARTLGFSEFVVGVAILSVGSDLPELVVAIDASLRNLQEAETAGLVVGTAIGSCICQIGLVLGIAALLGYVTLPRRIVFQHGGVMLGSLVILALLALDGSISRTEGASLLVLYAIYIAVMVVDRGPDDAEDGDGEEVPFVTANLIVIGGLAVVFGAAELTIHGVISIALAWEIEPALISILAVGLGTSLPELSISVAAMRKNRSRMSVGNLIGSNIFDTLVPIGVAASIGTLGFDATMLGLDLPFLFVLSALVLAFFLRKRGLQTGEAITLLALYGGYVVVRVVQS